MSSIPSKDTKVEWILRSRLWKEGLRYRTHKKELPGKPDIIFSKEKIAVFIDGDFWHGWGWKELKPKLKNDYWREKIKKNMERDNKTNKELRKNGWDVLRIWEHELRNNPEECVLRVKEALKNA